MTTLSQLRKLSRTTDLFFEKISEFTFVSLMGQFTHNCWIFRDRNGIDPIIWPDILNDLHSFET